MAPLNMNDDGNTKADFTAIIRNSKAVAEGDKATIKVLNILEQLHSLAAKGKDLLNNPSINTAV